MSQVTEINYRPIPAPSQQDWEPDYQQVAADGIEATGEEDTRKFYNELLKWSGQEP